MKLNLNDRVAFESRHNGPSNQEVSNMLKTVGLSSIDELISEAIPAPILKKEALNLPPSLNEFEYLSRVYEIASKNKVFKSFIGQGYYNCVVP
ncbi:MAG: hypothetical protein AAFY41_07885, partial [Bacteroidota bacterium]